MSIGVGIENLSPAAPHMTPPEMASVPMLTTFNPNVKDSRWLTLEVCREFTRNKCTRPDTECKFAHPPPHVEVQNGRVTCCFDSIKGKCQRKDPPCKYLHPPQHLREQLVQNGRNNLILKQFQAQAITNSIMYPSVYPNMIPLAGAPGESGLPVGDKTGALTSQAAMTLPVTQPAASAYTNVMAQPSFLPYTGFSSPYIGTVPGMISPLDASAGMNQVSASLNLPGVPTIPATTNGATAQQKVQRPDRLESVESYTGSSLTPGGGSNSAGNAGLGDVAALSAAQNGSASQYGALYSLQASTPLVEVLPLGKKRPRDPNEDLLLAGMTQQMPGMMLHHKRAAMPDKTGMPMFTPQGAATQAAYSQLVQFPQQQYVPVTQTLQYYRGEQTSPYSQMASHHSIPRY